MNLTAAHVPDRVRRARAKARNYDGGYVLLRDDGLRVVAGTARVSFKALHRKLTDNAYAVWDHLVRTRDAQGFTTEPATRIARKLKMAYRTVEDALRKLRRAGLLTLVRWQLKKGARAGLAHARTHVPVRKVHGEPPFTRHVLWAVVPDATALWLATPETRGGARAGAGRKRRVLALRHESKPVVPKFKTRGGSDLFSSLHERCSSNEEQNPRTRAAGVGPASQGEGEPLALAAVVPPPPPARRPPEQPEALAAKLAVFDLEVLNLPPDAPFRRAVETGCASVNPNRPAPAPLHPAATRTSYPGVPPFVSVAAFAASIPPPPKLDPGDPLQRHVYLLAEWYRGAVHKKYGVRPFLSRGPLVPTSRHWQTLARIAPLFIEHDIAPAAWVDVALGLYEEHAREHVEAKASGKKKSKRVKFPGLAWVYSMTRMNQSRWQFRTREGDYQGAAIVHTPAGRRLMEAQAKMRGAFLFAKTDEDVAAVVARYFPDDSHAELVALAKKEAKEMREDIRSQVAAGGWLW